MYSLLISVLLLSLHCILVRGFNFFNPTISTAVGQKCRFVRIKPSLAAATLHTKTDLSALDASPEVLRDEDRTYCFCSRCKSAFFLDEAKLGRTGSRVICSVCNRDWFQTTSSLLKAGNAALVLSMPPEQVEQAKRNAVGNFARYNHKTKATVFVGNLPISYTEKDIEEIFAEYGILSTQLIRDKTDGSSKGFAFLEICEQAEADRLIKEMHNYYTAPNMRMTVKAAAQQPPQTGRRYPSAQTSSSPPRSPLPGTGREKATSVIASGESSSNTADVIETGNVRADPAKAPVRRVWNRHARKTQIADEASNKDGDTT